jgi:hypothetical protein
LSYPQLSASRSSCSSSYTWRGPDPRDSRAIAERELQVNSIRPGERIHRQVSVFKRPAIEYLRATRGLLVLTDRRLLYLGVEPRDLLAAPDFPPTFEERDFPLDTSVRVTSGRTFFGIAKAIVITTPRERIKLGVPSGAWPEASSIIADMGVRYTQAVAASAEQRKFLARAEGAAKERGGGPKESEVLHGSARRCTREHRDDVEYHH